MSPVCTEDRSGFTFLATSSMSMNIVGVPITDVHFSSTMACMLACGSKLGDGSTIVQPWMRALRLPITQPMVWYRGQQQQILAYFSL